MSARTDLPFHAAKRSIDIVLSLASLTVLSPLLIVVAIGIKITSPGPVFYRNTVVGKNGKHFMYFKFRSMRSDTGDDAHRAFIQSYVQEGGGHIDPITGNQVYKLTSDPRVTPVGRILRRLSIDEFPQMFDVLRGDMSIVGPRPPVAYEYELYDDRMRQRLLVKPGITGLNQIRARAQSSFEEMLADDLEYIRNQSLWLDLKIIFMTPWVMLFGKGPV